MTVSIEPNGPYLMGRCLDSQGLSQGWSAEVGPFGSPNMVEKWRDGKRDGISIFYSSDMFSAAVGEPQHVAYYRDGIAQGPDYLFLEGVLRLDMSRDSGERHGCYYEWHASGEMNSRGRLAHGQRAGLWETWDVAGTPRARAWFSSGRLNRLERFRDGKWQKVSPPAADSCSRFADSVLKSVPWYRESDGLDPEELGDSRDSCLLHLTETQLECFFGANSEQDKARCVGGSL